MNDSNVPEVAARIFNLEVRFGGKELFSTSRKAAF